MNGIFVLVPIMVMGVAVAGIVSASIIKLQRLRLEEARLHSGDPDQAHLVHQVAALQNEVAEIQERLEFAERLLAQGRERPSLPEPPHPSEGNAPLPDPRG